MQEKDINKRTYPFFPAHLMIRRSIKTIPGRIRLVKPTLYKSLEQFPTHKLLDIKDHNGCKYNSLI